MLKRTFQLPLAWKNCHKICSSKKHFPQNDHFETANSFVTQSISCWLHRFAKFIDSNTYCLHSAVTFMHFLKGEKLDYIRMDVPIYCQELTTITQFDLTKSSLFPRNIIQIQYVWERSPVNGSAHGNLLQQSSDEFAILDNPEMTYQNLVKRVCMRSKMSINVQYQRVKTKLR